MSDVFKNAVDCFEVKLSESVSGPFVCSVLGSVLTSVWMYSQVCSGCFTFSLLSFVWQDEVWVNCASRLSFEVHSTVPLVLAIFFFSFSVNIGLGQI